MAEVTEPSMTQTLGKGCVCACVHVHVCLHARVCTHVHECVHVCMHAGVSS